LSSQTVEQQMPAWLSVQQTLELQGLEGVKELRELERRKGVLQLEAKSAYADQLSFKQELAKLQAWQDLYEQEHHRVKTALAHLQPSWERLVSAHEKMDSIRDKLEEGIERRTRQKQQLLHNERLAFRYVDDYADQEEFFADPQAAQLAGQWNNQFSLLETGIQYAAAVAETVNDKLLWAVTLVTTSQEKSLLQRKLAETADQLQFPIRVLSTQEAKVLISGSPVGEADTEATWVEPAHWKSLHDSELFKEWKREIIREADATADSRRDKENELEAWRDSQKLSQAFFRDYSLIVVHEQEQSHTRMMEQLRRLEQRLSQVEQELRQLDRQKNELDDAQKLLAQQQQHVAFQLEQGQLYMQLSEKISRLVVILQPLQMALLKAERVIDRCSNRLEDLERELKKQDRGIHDIHGKLQQLLETELYSEVQDCLPQFTEESFVQLREERKGLDLQRHRIMKERSELEQELDHQRDRTNEASRQMERLTDAHERLDKVLELPMHVESKLKMALTELRTTQEDYKRVHEAWDRKDRELSSEEAVVQVQLKQYAMNFDNEPPVLFLEALSSVRKKQADERRQQDEARSELERLKSAVERKLRETRIVLQLWNSYIRVHKLDDPLLEMLDYGRESIQEMTYRLETVSKEVLRRLDQQNDIIVDERRKVSTSRQRFREFCQRQVQDVKLREMAERGVEGKDNYAELQEFEVMMAGSILKANQIAELRMQTEDQKLQQFITHIQAHLKLIAQEIRELPKRTRVRTESGNKDIYVFQVPDWDEQEGKERIRHHIEWIIIQLEHAKYQDVDGSEQRSAVRKDLEKWLDAKQLLKKVFQQGSAIRISCRKVNNDQQVTGATYSWEESNRWSGGEKWSKNMTLFLGILNYVAEKRQHIHSQMKRHRAVILDNPFGKASSDHVLSPVFYIAEQLGFQMIALTAHVEGKFLQDYFPIVYSCRLRAATGGGGKQIVNPQQRIQQAYFRDHAPESMDRIGGEMKQTELF